MKSFSHSSIFFTPAIHFLQALNMKLENGIPWVIIGLISQARIQPSLVVIYLVKVSI